MTGLLHFTFIMSLENTAHSVTRAATRNSEMRLMQVPSHRIVLEIAAGSVGTGLLQLIVTKYKNSHILEYKRI